ncbi:uncharacterized protein YjiS (DUF1127 family) [Nocardia kruczakiae]|uniref:Uncharacterized protein YjiS (DUF1127 family) n=1 Tax=Nocardia kruczakiae TaxID=261477 RepID=A0ABU1XF03_9NOCA|nr:DUF222 domain-containing protein [Nocardia kruczakiae]MDR7169117.1 uncharacterized protein YjiS (DUF1127 family) [Nocardia kruczakiae]
MFDGRELQAMSDEGLVDALRRAHGAAAFAQAAEVRAVRELYRRHRAGNAAPGPGGVRAGEFAAAEVSMAVQISEQVAAALIDIGLALDALPHTREAFGSGRIDLSRVQVIVDNARGLSTDLLADLEVPLVEAAARTTPARLRQTARRWLSRLDGPGEQRRREQREDCRDIRLTAVQDGAAVVAGLLPADGAETVAMRLRDMAYEVCPEDPRTMPQRRADALVALAVGAERLDCACGRGMRCTATVSEQTGPDAPRTSGRARSHRPLIQVGVSAEALSGESEEPAHLVGYGPIDAEFARRIAERGESVTVVESGVRIDGLCAFPGCVMPSATTDLPVLEGSTGNIDANRPGDAAGSPRNRDLALGTESPSRESAYARGNRRTTARGSHGSSPGRQGLTLCAHHARLTLLTVQHRTRWEVRRLDADRVQWTSPTGDVHTTVDEVARYLFPHRDTETPAVVSGPVSTSVAAWPVSTLDPSYPIGDHALVHRRLAEGTPEDCLLAGESYRR